MLTVSVYYNLEKLACFNIANRVTAKIVPELKLESVQDPSNTENSKVSFILSGEAFQNVYKNRNILI